jgi:predicted  nucleic acid-binding Zn-ribbon protein
MEQNLSPKELELAVLSARITAPDIGDDEFPAVVELQRRLKESGYLEIVQAIRRQEEELGEPYTETLEVHSRLLRQNQELDALLVETQGELAALKGRIKKARNQANENESAAQRARMERERQEKELAAFMNKVVKEKQRLARELQEAQEKARVSMEEIPLAGEIKVEVEARGLSIEQALALIQEFPEGKDDCQRLVETMERHGSLTKAVTALAENKRQLESNLAYLEQRYRTVRGALSQIEREKDFQERVHRFYLRFWSSHKLLECLVTWEWVYFRKCNRCGNRFWFERKPPKLFNFQRPHEACPCCGSLSVTFDAQAHQGLGWAPDLRGGKIILG